MEQIDCESRIERVVVYARGAVVTRQVTLPASLPGGAVELCIAGITALAEAGSVRALARGEREVTAIKARVAIPAAPVKTGRLREQVRALELELERLERASAYLVERREGLSRITPEPRFARWASRVDPAARFQDALAAGGLVGDELKRLHDRLRANREARVEVQLSLEAAKIEERQAASQDREGASRAELGVRVRLAGGEGALAALEIDYIVTAARWWPAYTARLTEAATRVSFGLEAFVAQASGEEWSGVALSVATADLASDARLPELRSLRIGRAQAAPRKGYRPAPAGLEAMFEGHDRSVNQGDLESEPLMVRTADVPDDDEEMMTRSVSTTAAGRVAMPQPMQMPRPAAAPSRSMEPMPQAIAMPSRAMAALPPKSGKIDLKARLGKSAMMPDMYAMPEHAGLLGGAVAHDEPVMPAAIEPDEAWLDFDALTIGDPLAPENRGRRGRLGRDLAGGIGSRAAAARATIEALGSPPETRDPLETRGKFDHRYDAEGKADVPSSGLPHRVTIGSAEGEARPRFVAVPREAAEVYREAEIPNPFAAPLLSGPAEVFIDGALLATSSLDFVDRGGLLRLGLGVEERLRVARNARVEEGSAGLLGGSTTVDHHVTIDVASSLGHAVTVEVIDRIPVTLDKDIEIKLVSFKPAATKFESNPHEDPVRGGLTWKIKVSPGEKQRIELTYRVTLPAKNELVGGNRRE